VTTGSQHYHAENFKEPKYHLSPKSQFHRFNIERVIEETLFLSDPVKDPALTCLRFLNLKIKLLPLGDMHIHRNISTMLYLHISVCKHCGYIYGRHLFRYCGFTDEWCEAFDRGLFVLEISIAANRK
jgi:hypothetical protein